MRTLKELQFGHSAYFKNKKTAKNYAKKMSYKLERTKHTILGKGWLVSNPLIR